MIGVDELSEDADPMLSPDEVRMRSREFRAIEHGGNRRPFTNRQRQQGLLVGQRVDDLDREE